MPSSELMDKTCTGGDDKPYLPRATWKSRMAYLAHGNW